MSGRVIKIAYPLDMSVAGALLRAIGTMWPSAAVDQSGGNHMVIKIPDSPAGKVSKKALRQMLEEGDPNSRIEATSFDGTTLTTTVPEDFARTLAAWAYELLSSTEGVTNYLEHRFTHPDTEKQLVVIACWSQEQTPHELRTKAEAELQQLRDKITRTLAQHGHAALCPCTEEAGEPDGDACTCWRGWLLADDGEAS